MSERSDIVQAVAVLGLGVVVYLAIENIGRGLAGIGKGFGDIGAGFNNLGAGVARSAQDVTNWATPDPGQSLADSLTGRPPGYSANLIAPTYVPLVEAWKDPLALGPITNWADKQFDPWPGGGLFEGPTMQGPLLPNGRFY